LRENWMWSNGPVQSAVDFQVREKPKQATHPAVRRRSTPCGSM
jgi:hypothetical protein